jgi:hypothetical protein
MSVSNAMATAIKPRVCDRLNRSGDDSAGLPNSGCPNWPVVSTHSCGDVHILRQRRAEERSADQMLEPPLVRAELLLTLARPARAGAGADGFILRAAIRPVAAAASVRTSQYLMCAEGHAPNRESQTATGNTGPLVAPRRLGRVRDVTAFARQPAKRFQHGSLSHW